MVLTTCSDCVLDGLLSEDEIEELANRHGLDMDADLRFKQSLGANGERDSASVWS